MPAGSGRAAGAVISDQVGSDNTTTGAVIGGVLGGAAGYALSLQAVERARTTVRKMCDSLPTRL